MDKFIIICPLCSYDLTIANLLARYNLEYVVFRDKFSKKDEFPRATIRAIFGDKNDLYQLIDKGDVIINGTNSLYYLLGMKNCLRFLFFKRNKIINWPTGSDITELSISKNLHGLIYRLFLRSSFIKIVPPYTYAIANSIKLKLKEYLILRYPYKLEKNLNLNYHAFNSEVVFFSPANLDFSKNKDIYRNSTKGNNRFIRAFCKAYLQKKYIRCILLYRGPDKDHAKTLIPEECLNAFTFLKPQSTEELLKYFNKVDCVVDQFDVGGFGMIAMEAMSQAKPVMIHIDNNCWPLVYDDAPPVINCHTEDEIYQAIMEWSDHKKLQELGEKAEKWVRKYHDVHTADFSEFILRVCIAAGLEWPRKDLAKSKGDV